MKPAIDQMIFILSPSILKLLSNSPSFRFIVPFSGLLSRHSPYKLHASPPMIKLRFPRPYFLPLQKQPSYIMPSLLVNQELLPKLCIIPFRTPPLQMSPFLKRILPSPLIISTRDLAEKVREPTQTSPFWKRTSYTLAVEVVEMLKSLSRREEGCLKLTAFGESLCQVPSTTSEVYIFSLRKQSLPSPSALSLRICPIQQPLGYRMRPSMVRSESTSRLQMATLVTDSSLLSLGSIQEVSTKRY